MISKRTVIVQLVLVSLAEVSLAQIGSDYKKLHNEIFNKRSYQKSILPRVNKNRPLPIFFSFSLHGLISLEEIEEKLTTIAHLTLEWNNTFMSWEEADFSNISYFYMPQNDVWKPDISLQNGFTKLKELGDDVILVKIRSSGVTKWKPFEVLETMCEIDITKFPFDTQVCKLVFRMWTTESQDLKFVLRDPAINLLSYEANGVWELRSATIELVLGHAIILLTLDRRPQHYMLTLICPIILLSVLSIFTFIIPVNSGEKMGYSMTVYLAFAVLLTIFSSSLPVNSRTTSYLAVYLIILVIKGTSIVILTAVQVRIHDRPQNMDVSPRIQRFIRITKRVSFCCGSNAAKNRVKDTQKITPMSRKSDNNAQLPPVYIAKEKFTESCEYEAKVDEIFTWVDFSSALDRFCFCFFSTVAVVLAMWFFISIT
ncbi:neuronal acetylcholine receptor subunit beta-4-like [Ylistrum balloti]|uniref:neuronal acetylcholine receptor subunit beta-4-like n=1 Tax=Ylistrum balloti TaxID=509963 RepID=UPI002905D42F|nr:neuronal acetylcholine receptor subunit beta-4-like [Ylistrum balloti]